MRGARPLQSLPTFKNGLTRQVRVRCLAGFEHACERPAKAAEEDYAAVYRLGEVAMAKRSIDDIGLMQRIGGELFRPTRLCLIALALLALISWPYVKGKIPKLSDQPEYAVTVNNIHISAPPEWVPSDITQQVYNRAGLPDRMSLLDEGLVQQVSDAFRLHPWVKSVERVEKHQPTGVTVALTYRKPVAFVEVPDGLYPIDADGILLPPRDFRQTDVGRYPIISRVTSVPSGNGQPWDDPVVLGAARLAEILIQKNEDGTQFWNALKVQKIESPNRIAANDSLDDLIYRLRTPGGSRIIWGRAPGTGHPGEVTAGKKIRRLEEYLADYGGYETAHGPSELDIRHWHEISHRAIAVQPETNRQRQ